MSILALKTFVIGFRWSTEELAFVEYIKLPLPYLNEQELTIQQATAFVCNICT